MILTASRWIGYPYQHHHIPYWDIVERVTACRLGVLKRRASRGMLESAGKFPVHDDLPATLL